MSKRRNPFENSEPTQIVKPPPGIYDSLRVAVPRKRNRQWEKKHQSQKAVFRGVDPKLSLKVKSIAADLSVPAGEVARAVIEHALRAHDRGDFGFHPRPNPYRMRMTLFPTSDSARSYVSPTGSKKTRGPDPTWRVITTWRSFPPELKHGLAALASKDGLNVPLGELITALLRFGLKAYDSGFLILQPVQKAGTYTLAQDDRK